MKKLYKILFFVLLFFIAITVKQTVKANSIDRISMDIYVDSNGNANITEVWSCKVDNGTEVYHPYYNLGNSKISNLTVSDGNKTYTTLNKWNTSGSLSSKAYKCGINKISNGVELCWGMSNYGIHTYTVKYSISNFVSSLTDSQMIYWTLIPYSFSNSIGKVSIKIYATSKINSSTTNAWGYGNYGGLVYVYDGRIEMQSSGTLYENEYMTILVKFPSGTFNAENKLNHNFEYYYKMAQEGSTKYQGSNNEFYKIIYGILCIIFYIFILFIGIANTRRSKYDFGEQGKKFNKDTPYFRDIPCDGDLFKTYYIAEKYEILSKRTDLLGAIILKWLKESKIRIEQKGEAIFKKEETVVILNETNLNDITNVYERQIFDMLYKASEDGILENKELERWCRKNYTKILKWFEDILEEEKKLIENGLITIEKIKKFKVFNCTKYHISPEIRRKAEEIYGLKRYLLDYTLITDRKAIEVELFEEYLILAQMLGIAKQVAKEFKDLYPEVIEQSHFTSYDYIMFVHITSNNGVSAARSSNQSHSSGGGGGGRIPLNHILDVINIV